MTDSHDPIYVEALERLRFAFEEAQARGVTEARAASLATTKLKGQPSIRMVSVVAIDDAGPLFFVDRRSGKGRQLEDNPCAALCFFWPQLHQQITIEGHVDSVDTATADRHWANRPREAQLAAWLAVAECPPTGDDGREALAAARHRFASRRVPRPSSWQALHLNPDALRFWKPGWHQPHDREHYFRDETGCWQRQALAPL